MSVDAVVFWLFVIAWILVVGLIALVALPTAIRAAMRLLHRVVAIGQDSSLPLEFAKAQGNIGRVERAIGRLPSLERRARTALEVIRNTSLVPPVFFAARAQIRTEIAAFRRAAR